MEEIDCQWLPEQHKWPVHLIIVWLLLWKMAVLFGLGAKTMWFGEKMEKIMRELNLSILPIAFTLVMSFRHWVHLRIHFLGLQTANIPREEEANTCVSNIQS